jgi:hypothetical protein
MTYFCMLRCSYFVTMATCFMYLHTIRKQKDDKQNQKYWPQETWISIHATLYAAFLVERFSCKVITRNSTIRPTAFKPTWWTLQIVYSETFACCCYHYSCYCCSQHCYFSRLLMHTSNIFWLNLMEIIKSLKFNFSGCSSSR